MIVLDASAAVELLLGSARGEAVRRRIGQPDETLHAPHLLDIEVAQVLRRLQRVGMLGVERATEAIEDLIHMTCYCRACGTCAAPSRHTMPSTSRWQRYWTLRC